MLVKLIDIFISKNLILKIYILIILNGDELYEY